MRSAAESSAGPPQGGRRPSGAGAKRLGGSISLAVALALLLAAQAAGAAESASAPPDAQQVRQAVEAVRQDPLLGGKKTERTLRWKASERKDPAKAPQPSGSNWFVEFLAWIAESARVLVWVLGAICAALLLVLLRRWIALRADTVGGKAILLPSHVRDLDIRPESLPDDIAGEARALWLRGQQRAALSLLYRGALSRLVHEHGVAIRSSSTEGDCVSLARRSLPDIAAAYFQTLVDAWLLSVYGGRSADDATVMSLCEQFDRQLPVRKRAQEPAGALKEASA